MVSRRSSLPLRLSLALLGVGFGLSASCSREETAPPPPPAQAPQAQAPAAVEFRVTRIDLGNAIGADKKVASPATSFKPGDTIYASVQSEGAAPSVVLVARWTFEDGQLVNESSQSVVPSGPAITEFHIAKPDGWPVGKYKVDVTANGKPAGTAEFTVTG